MKALATPDITPTQIISVIASIVTQIVALGWVDNDTGQLILQLAGIVVPAIWMIADAIIRHGRAQALYAPRVVLASDKDC